MNNRIKHPYAAALLSLFVTYGCGATEAQVSSSRTTVVPHSDTASQEVVVTQEATGERTAMLSGSGREEMVLGDVSLVFESDSAAPGTAVRVVESDGELALSFTPALVGSFVAANAQSVAVTYQSGQEGLFVGGEGTGLSLSGGVRAGGTGATRANIKPWAKGGASRPPVRGGENPATVGANPGRTAGAPASHAPALSLSTQSSSNDCSAEQATFDAAFTAVNQAADELARLEQDLLTKQRAADEALARLGAYTSWRFDNPTYCADDTNLWKQGSVRVELPTATSAGSCTLQQIRTHERGLCPGFGTCWVPLPSPITTDTTPSGMCAGSNVAFGETVLKHCQDSLAAAHQALKALELAKTAVANAKARLNEAANAVGLAESALIACIERPSSTGPEPAPMPRQLPILVNGSVDGVTCAQGEPVYVNDRLVSCDGVPPELAPMPTLVVEEPTGIDLDPLPVDLEAVNRSIAQCAAVGGTWHPNLTASGPAGTCEVGNDCLDQPLVGSLRNQCENRTACLGVPGNTFVLVGSNFECRGPSLTPPPLAGPSEIPEIDLPITPPTSWPTSPEVPLIPLAE